MGPFFEFVQLRLGHIALLSNGRRQMAKVIWYAIHVRGSNTPPPPSGPPSFVLALVVTNGIDISLDKPATGSIYKIAWSADGTQVSMVQKCPLPDMRVEKS